MRVFLFLLLLPIGVSAQSAGHEWMLDDLRTCFAAEDIGAKRDCIGQASNACQEAEEGGYSTLGMSMCNNDEYEAWDVLLNEQYKLTMAAFKGMDVDEGEYFSSFAVRVESLRDAQRAWIAFRDAECTLEYAIWGSGSMRNIAGSACYVDMTAQRTIDLWAMREEY